MPALIVISQIVATGSQCPFMVDEGQIRLAKWDPRCLTEGDEVGTFSTLEH